MAINGIITSQTGARQFNPNNFTNYSYFVGGVNATNHALRNYSPLLNNFGRLFMVRCPNAIQRMFSGKESLYSKDSQFTQFKHMLEYMNRSVSGFGEKTLQAASTSIQGGYAGRQFFTPTVTQETTNEITIGLYEFVGMPVYTVIDAWMNAIGDENSGLATYGGYVSGGRGVDLKEKRLYTTDADPDTTGYEFNEAEHTAEFIYCLTDRTGSQVERAVLLADCWPKTINEGNALNSEGTGAHDNVTYDITWNCVVYRSAIINAIANDLLKQYRIVSNSLNFNPELGDAIYQKDTLKLNMDKLGNVPEDGALGTTIGNAPVFYSNNAPKTQNQNTIDVNVDTNKKYKLAGQT